MEGPLAASKRASMYPQCTMSTRIGTRSLNLESEMTTYHDRKMRAANVCKQLYIYILRHPYLNPDAMGLDRANDSQGVPCSRLRIPAVSVVPCIHRRVGC